MNCSPRHFRIPEFLPKLIFPTFHSHRVSIMISVTKYPTGFSLSFILSVVNGIFQRWLHDISNLMAFPEPCHCHIKEQGVNFHPPNSEQTCDFHVSRRVWQKSCYVHLKTGLNRIQHPFCYLRSSQFESQVFFCCCLFFSFKCTKQCSSQKFTPLTK